MRRFTSLAALAFLAAFPAGSSLHAAQDDKTSTKAWTVEDVINAESAGGWQISPDNKWAVWVKRSPDIDKGVLVFHLMLSSLTDKTTIQLTRGQHSCTHPRW